MRALDQALVVGQSIWTVQIDFIPPAAERCPFTPTKTKFFNSLETIGEHRLDVIKA